MAGICSPVSPYSSIQHRLQRVNGFCCCSSARAYMKKKAQPSPTPQLLKIAVSGVTELLRFFSSGKDRLDTENYDQRNKVSLLSIEDVLMIIKSDYESAYFVTGIFSSAIYSEDCLFEDPTIKFRGTELYARNLKLLVPFFDHPSIALKKIEKSGDLRFGLVGGLQACEVEIERKGVDAETNFVLATWKLRTYLRLPWRPLISINGSTVYDLDDKFKIVRHAESWDVSALEAIGQIFTPSFERSNG